MILRVSIESRYKSADFPKVPLLAGDRLQSSLRLTNAYSLEEIIASVIRDTLTVRAFHLLPFLSKSSRLS